ncbi:hypothetical protein [Andreprevotia chitinilytica]|uniref:hypothetical protein n=1 Tax=Andreprevotia chitinilytica TaxID=396808 RepID=UPI000A003B7D|nr:hypothetical protein [Andreprevotia chitinilytica]
MTAQFLRSSRNSLTAGLIASCALLGLSACGSPAPLQHAGPPSQTQAFYLFQLDNHDCVLTRVSAGLAVTANVCIVGPAWSGQLEKGTVQWQAFDLSDNPLAVVQLQDQHAGPPQALAVAQRPYPDHAWLLAVGGPRLQFVRVELQTDGPQLLKYPPPAQRIPQGAPLLDDDGALIGVQTDSGQAYSAGVAADFVTAEANSNCTGRVGEKCAEWLNFFRHKGR